MDGGSHSPRWGGGGGAAHQTQPLGATNHSEALPPHVPIADAVLAAAPLSPPRLPRAVCWIRVACRAHVLPRESVHGPI